MHRFAFLKQFFLIEKLKELFVQSPFNLSLSMYSEKNLFLRDANDPDSCPDSCDSRAEVSKPVSKICFKKKIIF